MTLLEPIFKSYNLYVGYYALLILVIGVGLLYTFGLKGLHFKLIPHALGLLTSRDANTQGTISPFRALSTALAGTIGTGCIVGVAMAIKIGGPGALFWMWVSAILGISTKLGECTLGHYYRETKPSGVRGGPMYFISKGLKGPAAKTVAKIFAMAVAITALGIGVVQMNSIADAFHQTYRIPTLTTAAVISILTFLILIGGLKRISTVCAFLFPFMGLIYFSGTLLIVLTHLQSVIPVFKQIFHDAFTGTAAVGGFAGSAFLTTARYGVARGLFTNEAGGGSSSMAHATADTDHSFKEGLIASLGPIVDTLIVCSCTGFAILLTGTWTQPLEGVAITSTAFETGLAFLNVPLLTQNIVPLCLFLFAFSTVLSYAYYGECGLEYLWGEKGFKTYRVLLMGACFLGCISSVSFAWNFIEMAYSFMAIPTLISMVLLFPKVKELALDYFQAKK